MTLRFGETYTVVDSDTEATFSGCWVGVSLEAAVRGAEAMRAEGRKATVLDDADPCDVRGNCRCGGRLWTHSFDCSSHGRRAA